MTSTPVDVVVLTWNDGELLQRAVDSVDLPEAEIIVVDNGSEPPAAPRGDRIRLVRLEENRGVAAGRNVGARAGTAEVVCFLDSDAELLPGSLRRMVDRLLSDEHVGLVAPTFVDQAPEASGGAAPTLGRKLARVAGRTDAYESTDRGSAPAWDVDFAIGACQVFRRTAFERIRGLDERYFYGPEDADFCMRLRLDGWRVVQVSDAPVLHPPRRRNRKLATMRGLRHALAVSRFLVRHRGFQRRVAKVDRSRT